MNTRKMLVEYEEVSRFETKVFNTDTKVERKSHDPDQMQAAKNQSSGVTNQPVNNYYLNQ